MNNYAHKYMRMAEWFITGEELNLLVDKAVPDNTNEISSYTVSIFDDIIYY